MPASMGVVLRHAFGRDLMDAARGLAIIMVAAVVLLAAYLMFG